jgi:hypothetical protein
MLLVSLKAASLRSQFLAPIGVKSPQKDSNKFVGILEAMQSGTSFWLHTSTSQLPS